MTTVSEEAREGSATADGAVPESKAEARAQARTSLTRRDSIAFEAVTQSARALFRGTMSAATAIDRAESLGDAQPKTLRQAWAWHRRCAAHYAAGILRRPREAWGLVHVATVKPLLNFLEWLTESPARFLVALAVVVVIKRKIPLPEVTWWP